MAFESGADILPGLSGLQSGGEQVCRGSRRHMRLTQIVDPQKNSCAAAYF